MTRSRFLRSARISISCTALVALAPWSASRAHASPLPSPQTAGQPGGQPAGHAAAWITSWAASLDGVVDFDRVLRDPSAPTRLLPAFDSGAGLEPV